MNSHVMTKFLSLTLMLLTVSQVVWSQEQDTEDGEYELQDTEIVIEKDREIKLNKATKVYEFIKYKPESEKYEVPNDGFKAYDYDRMIEPTVFDPPEVELEEQGPDYRQFLKVGFGNYNSPIVDLSLTTPSNTNKALGLNYKHLSFAKGEVDDENSASGYHDLTVYGTLIEKNIRVEPFINYRHDRNYLYGYEPVDPIPNRNEIKRVNAFFAVGVKVEDNNNADDWTYDGGVVYHNFSDNYDNSEGQVQLDANVGWDKTINLETSLLAGSFNAGDSSQSRAYFRLLPYYSAQWGDITADLGLSFNIQNDDLSALNSVKAFPYIKAQYDINDQYKAFLKLDGGYDVNTMNSIARDLNYLSPVFAPQNTEVNFKTEVGVTSAVTDQLFVEARLGYSQAKNFMIYVNDIINRSLISPAYDTGNVGIGTIGLSANYFLDDKNDFSFVANFYSYSMSLEGVEAYHRPSTEITLKGSHEFFEKLTYQWQLGVLAGIQALDTSNENVTLDPIAKLDMMFHYQIIDRIGAFVSFDNMFSQSYQRYLYYPERTFMVKIGATVRF